MFLFAVDILIPESFSFVDAPLKLFFHMVWNLAVNFFYGIYILIY